MLESKKFQLLLVLADCPVGHYSSIPMVLTVVARSKMVYGIDAFSNSAPSISPPSPPPTISTVGSGVDMVGMMDERKRGVELRVKGRRKSENSVRVGERVKERVKICSSGPTLPLSRFLPTGSAVNKRLCCDQKALNFFFVENKHHQNG